MKQLHRPTFIQGIVFILVLCLANIGSCWQGAAVSPMGSAMRQPMSPMRGNGVPFPAPTCGLQSCHNDNVGLGSGLVYHNNGCDTVKVPISVGAQVGYGHFGMTFSTQGPVFGTSVDRTNLDLSFRDANVPIGSVKARTAYSDLFLALGVQGSAARDIGIETSEAPFGGGPDWNGSEVVWRSPRSWNGSELQWWTLDGDMGYRVTPCWSALVGLRRDQLTVALTNPRDAVGTAQNFAFAAPGVIGSLTIHGDFSSKLWIPYLGMEITGQRYRASLLWSPLGWADIRVPYAYLVSIFYGLPPNSSVHVGIDYDYACQLIKKTEFLEYNFEYNLNVSPSFACQLWSSGNWMRLQGGGNFDGRSILVLASAGVPVFNTTTFAPSGSDMETTCTRSMISGGIGMELSF